jgi:hypothetical protein
MEALILDLEVLHGLCKELELVETLLFFTISYLLNSLSKTIVVFRLHFRSISLIKLSFELFYLRYSLLIVRFSLLIQLYQRAYALSDQLDMVLN